MQAHSEKFTLLLVDDNPTNLLLLEQIIEFDLPQVKVHSALSAEQGLELATQHRVDGALIDVQMPQMDGLEMCRRLRANPSTARIPMVLMTAHISAPELRAEGLEAGAYDFISQPIDNVEMLARIKVMLRLCETERRLPVDGDRSQEQPDSDATTVRWLSGLLLSGNGEQAELDQDWLRRAANGLPAVDGSDQQALYDRLTDDLPRPWRRTLFKLSLLDSVPLALTREISEIADIEAAINYLQRHTLVDISHTGVEDCLTFPLSCCELVRRKARQELTREEQQQVYRMATARYHQQQNYHQLLACLIAAEDYSGISQLLSQVGLEPFIGDGEGFPLALIDQLSEEVVATCGWMSLFCGINRLYRFAHDVDIWLELAFQHFTRQADGRGALLARSSQILLNYYVDSHWEPWQDRFDKFREAMERERDLLGPAEMLEVIYAAGTAKLAFSGLLERIEGLLAQTRDHADDGPLWRQRMKLQLLRTRYALHQGRLLLAHSAFEQSLRIYHKHSSQIAELERLMLCMTACELLQATGNLAELQQRHTFSSGCLTLQRRPALNTVLAYESASLLLAAGQYQQAADQLDVTLLTSPAATPPHLRSLLVQLRGWLGALSGDKDSALVDLEAGLNLRAQAHSSLFAMENRLLAAATCCCLGRYGEAEGYLAQTLQDSLQLGEERLRLGVYAWLAVVAHQRGRKKDRAAQLDVFFELLRRHRRLYFPGLSPDLLEQLMAISDVGDRQLLAPLAEKYLATKFINPAGQLVATLFVDCLGGFVLRRGNVRLDMHQFGHASRQILATLLTASSHAVSSEVIMGRLWPDSPPVKARNSFDVAHSRLRRALEDVFGRDIRSDYLILDKGMLLLRQVRIDAIQFQEGMKAVHYHLQRENDWQAELALWQLHRLWRGEFMSGYDLGGELQRYRGHLNQLRLEQLDQLARLLLKRGQSDEASRLLRVGLALEPTQDSMVRLLLRIYREQQDYRNINQVVSDYRTALQREDYGTDEIDEMMESL